jgi:hypothetical protein
MRRIVLWVAEKTKPFISVRFGGTVERMVVYA